MPILLEEADMIVYQVYCVVAKFLIARIANNTPKPKTHCIVAVSPKYFIIVKVRAR